MHTKYVREKPNILLDSFKLELTLVNGDSNKYTLVSEIWHSIKLSLLLQNPAISFTIAVSVTRSRFLEWEKSAQRFFVKTAHEWFKPVVKTEVVKRYCIFVNRNFRVLSFLEFRFDHYLKKNNKDKSIFLSVPL